MNGISSLDLYMITRLDYIIPVLIAMGIFCSIFCFSRVICDKKDEEEEVSCKKSATFSACLSIFFWTAVVLTPTTKEACAIIAIPKIINSEPLQDEAKEVYGIAKEWAKKMAEGAK